MIKINKIDPPSSIIQNKEKWTEEAQKYYEGNSDNKDFSTRYRQPDIKDRLVVETKSKCMYCESKILHVSYGDIEHIKPKSKRPDLIVDWDNLGLACTKCNNNKSSYYDSSLPLVNPYEDDPSEYFKFVGPMLQALIDERSIMTESVIGLNRMDLLERRADRLRPLCNLLEQIKLIENPEIKNALLLQVCLESDPSKEYSAMVRDYLSMNGFCL